MPAISFDAPSDGNVSSGQDALAITNKRAKEKGDQTRQILAAFIRG